MAVPEATGWMKGELIERVEPIISVVGLGNPGRPYENTRHNVGFRVVDQLALLLSVPLEERKFQARWGACSTNRQKILLVEPLTFMNRSGDAVSQLLRYFKIPPHQMLVIHDDLDLPLGRMRLVLRGGSGGHRGVASIMEHLGGQDFARLKLGIGRPIYEETVEAYVLRPPYPGQEEAFEQMIVRAVKAVETVLSSGMVKAMNLFNKTGTRGESPSRDPQRADCPPP